MKRLGAHVLFFLCLLGALGSLQISGAPKGVSLATRPASNTITTVNLQDFGTVGDGLTDDAPALQSALDALADAGGGTLLVPQGRYAIATPVEVDFAGSASAITIQGIPRATPDNESGGPGRGLDLVSEFIIKTGETNDALTLRNLASLVVEHLVFIGVAEARSDAKVTLGLHRIDNATVRHCEFYGLATLAAEGAIVYAEGCDLKIEDSAFLGCTSDSALSTSLVQNYNWRGVAVRDTRFIDYGNRPDYFSKTPLAVPFAWISVGGAAAVTNTSPRREVVVEDVFLDEGAYYGLSVRPDLFAVSGGSAISLVFVSGLRMNVSNLGEVGVRIQNVENVFMERSYFGWTHHSRGAMHFGYVGNAVLDQVECAASATHIIADSTVGELSVANSIYEQLDSQALVTRVITTANVEDAPAPYVQRRYLDVLGRKPDIAGYVYWTQQRSRCYTDAGCDTDERLTDYLDNQPPPAFSLDGRVTGSDGAPLSDTTVNLSGSANVTTSTDANGNYTFSNLPSAGEYSVAPVKNFYTFVAASRTFITPGGDAVADFTGTLKKFSVSGRVNDSDGQAVDDVTLTLQGGSNFQPRITATVNGAYSFADVPADSGYTITASKPSYNFSPASKSLALAADQIDFNFTGTPVKFNISGKVTSGTQPLAGASVKLSGAAHHEVLTDANGNYLIQANGGGNYLVTVSKQHYTFASPTYSFSNLDGHKIASFDGTAIGYNIIGTVLLNGEGLGGVTLKLTGDATATVVTTSNGNYSFTVNAGGAHTVTPSRPGYIFAQPSVTYSNLDQNRYVNFQATPLKFSINGRVNDANLQALGDVTLTLTAAGFPTRTAATVNGAYSFGEVPTGNYTITASKPFYNFSPASKSLALVADETNFNFTGTPVTFTISGTVTDGARPLPGALVKLSGATLRETMTDANGTYFLEVNGGGNYTVTVSKRHYTFANASRSFNILSAHQTASFDGAIIRYNITGSIIENGQALGGVSLNLTGDETATLTTESNGNYSFTVNAGGAYTVTPSKPGYIFTQPSAAFSDLGQNIYMNFQATRLKVSISGSVTDADSNPLEGVTLTLSGGAGFQPRTLTIVGSQYTFTDIPAGENYTLTPTKQHYSFNPASRSVMLLQNTGNANFTGVLMTYAISGKITDGIKPLAGALVTLDGTSRSNAVTDAQGNYRFEMLTAGASYTVVVAARHHTFVNSRQTFANLSDNQTASFAGTLNRYTLQGIVTHGGTPQPGVTIELSGDHTISVETSSDGTFSLTVDAGGDYILTGREAGYKFAIASYTYTDLGSNSYATFTTRLVPVLLTEEGSNRAIALDALTMLREPFTINDARNFNPDKQTRLMLFAFNVDLLPGETFADLKVVAEDANHNVYPLTVEYVGQVAGVVGLLQINVKLSAQLSNAGDVSLHVTVGDATGNKAVVKIE